MRLVIHNPNENDFESIIGGKMTIDADSLQVHSTSVWNSSWTTIIVVNGAKSNWSLPPGVSVINATAADYGDDDDGRTIGPSESDGDGGADSPYPSGYGWTHIVAASVAVTSIMLVIVLGNALVVIAVAVDRSLKGPQNWFIASLAISDLLVGLFIMPLSLSNELLGYWPFGSVLCQLWLATDVLLCTASILNLCLISLDRYWSIVRAVAYLRQRTPRRAITMIGAVWTLSAVICFPPLAGWSRPQPVLNGRPQCVLSEEPGYVIYSIVGSFYLPLIVMIAVYVKIYRAARWRARRHLNANSKMSSVSPPAAKDGAKPASLSSLSTRIAAAETGRCPPRRRQLLQQTAARVFLSPRHSGRGPQMSISSIDLDSEPTDDQRQQHRPEVQTPTKNDAIGRTDDVTSAGSDAAVDEMLTVVVIDRNRPIETVMDADDVVMQCDVIVPSTSDDCRRGDELEMSQMKRIPSQRKIAEILSSTVDQSRTDHGIVLRDNDGAMSARCTDKVVVVVISSTAESAVPAAATSSLSTTVKTPATELVNARSRRLSSTSSFLTVSTNCSPNNCGTQAAVRGGGGGVDEKKALMVSAKANYQSTKTTCSRNGSSASELAADDQSFDCGVVRSRRRLRPSWTGTTGGGRRRLSLALATTSARRGAKADGLFADTERAKRKAARARERRATIVLGIVMVSFIGCWLPFFAVYPAALLTGTKVPGVLFGVIFWLGYCNSALNPIIYTVFNRDFRRAFQKILLERISRRTSSWV
jgi:hypothetical protein